MKKITFILALFLSFSGISQYLIDDTDTTPFEDISTTGISLSLADDSSELVTMPFDFNFDGQIGNMVNVSNNGGLAFQSTYNFHPLNAPLEGRPPLIAVFWDDLYINSGGVYYETIGTAPNRRFIVQWDRSHINAQFGSFSFQAVLYESSFDIVFVYDDVILPHANFDNGASATIGIVTQIDDYEYSFNTASVFDGDAIRFSLINDPVIASCVPGLPVTLNATSTFSVSTTVSDTGVIGTAPDTYSINYALAYLIHSNVGNLSLTIISPSGVSLDLSSANGGATANYAKTFFQDGNPNITTSMGPFDGYFEPEGGTFDSTFAGESITGDWTLQAQDTGSGYLWEIQDFCVSFLYRPIVGDVPTLVCPVDFTQGTDAGLCTAVVNWSAPSGNDTEDGPLTATQTMGPASGSVLPIGDTTIGYMVTDSDDNTASCQFIVSVEDDIAPTVVCQNLTRALDFNGNASIIAAEIDNGSTDNCGIDTISLDISSFSCADLGQNTVVLTVTDLEGNSTSCTAIVTIEDILAPMALCQDVTLVLDANGNATLDPSDVDNGSNDVCGIDGRSLDQTAFSCDDLGANTVTLTVTDTSGNSTSCTATVTVEDTLEPSIACPLDQTVVVNNGSNYVLPDYFGSGVATATDNCTDPVVITTQDPVVGTALTEGIYTITLTATDASGNTAICTFELTVDETLATDDFSNANRLVIFPNPSEAIVNIGNPDAVQLEKLMVYDVAGRLVQQIFFSEINTNYEVNLNRLVSGNYILIIETSTGQFVQQLVKN